MLTTPSAGGELDAAGLAAAARVDLRLDDDRVAVQPLGHRHGVVDGADRLAGRDRDVERGEELLPLVLEEVHPLHLPVADSAVPAPS